MNEALMNINMPLILVVLFATVGVLSVVGVVLSALTVKDERKFTWYLPVFLLAVAASGYILYTDLVPALVSGK